MLDQTCIHEITLGLNEVSLLYVAEFDLSIFLMNFHIIFMKGIGQ